MVEWITANKEWIFSGAGVAVIMILLGLFRSTGKKDSTKEEETTELSPVTYFGDPETGKYNHKFYEFFTSLIRNAKEDIYLTGDGFEFADSEGRNVANSFNEALRHAMSRGVSVVRVQTNTDVHPEWAKMLGKLLKDFPDKFELYTLRAGKASQMSSACVIDPGFKVGCAVEIMLSSQKLFGTKAADLAGTAIFIQDKRNLAKDLRDRILKFTDPEISVPVRNEENANKILSKESNELYFAYGSNMSPEQMEKRTNNASQVTVGFLPDHEMVFNRKGSYRPGGVASVEKKNGKRVYGVVWKIPAIKLAELDEAEDPKAYARHPEKVIGEDGHEYLCHVYKSFPEGQFDPDINYIEKIISAAEEVKLPPEYISYLQEIKKKAKQKIS